MWVRGRRIGLVRGPVMLAIQRMVAAVRALVDAWESSRALHVRLRAGAFVVAVRLPRNGTVQLTLGSEDEGQVTIPELRVDEVALPILRLASDALRALVSVDRAQTRNLRVATLRDEVRSLRRRVKSLGPRVESVVHGDPERLRASAVVSREPVLAEPPLSARALRFDQRWHTEVEGLDAASTFLCGDRVIVATPRQIVAVAREGGQTLWSRRDPAAASFMTGTVLVRLAGDGRVSLCDPIDGEPFAQARVSPRVGPACGMLAGGGPIPPVALIGEGKGRLVAIDLRTAELRWRFATPGPGSFVLARSGRILLVVRGDGTLSALDVANGELLWRFAIDGRFTLAPVVQGDRVIAVSGACGDSDSELFAIDLFSGRPIWQRALERPLLSGPFAGSDTAVIALGAARGASLAGFSIEDGERRWSAADPGAAVGGAALAIDRTLVINGPLGYAAAIELDTGETRWKRRLAHPVADDVPRRLEPVLRGGALFVPAAQVHVLRPHDGTSIADAISCDLVPDWMRVDERGWIYVAEESGHLSAFAPRPQLSLVR
jgi:outer membrane protein assembly factor BamB